jgi:hypothetical protein
MKTYEITATLHDGRVLTKKTTENNLMWAIQYFLNFNHLTSSEIESLTVTEVKL